MKNKYYSIIRNDKNATIEIHTMPILYRYQSINPYSVSALLQDELWGTVPTSFNDPYDTIFCYTSNKLKLALQEKLLHKDIEKYKKFFNVTTKSQLIDILLESLLDNYNDNFRKMYCISCFSENYDSEIMWGHYANCAKGFVVAYDGQELSDISFGSNKVFYDIVKTFNPLGIDLSNVKEDNLTTIAPVIYENGKMNSTSEIITIIDSILEYYDDLCNGKTISEAVMTLYKKNMQMYYEKQTDNNNLFYSALCNKSKVWSYEKEWRIWAYNSNILTGQINNPYVLIGKGAKAKAIYLGEKISDYDTIALTEIARQKNIPVYKMKTIMLKHKCKLIAELIK